MSICRDLLNIFLTLGKLITYFMNTGTIKFFNESKGYGFIKDESSNQEIFVHVTGLEDKVKQNDKVAFKVVDGKKGLSAVNVKKI